MRKTYQFRLYPTKAQETRLRATLEECRWLYNHLLERHIEAYKTEKKALHIYNDHKYLTQLKKTRPSLSHVYTQVLQQVAVRLDLAYQAFFRRVKAGEKPGYPRFKGRGRVHSFTFPQSGFKIDGGELYIAKVGLVPLVQHCPTFGTIKTCTIKVTPTGKWFASFSVEVEPQPLPANPNQIGIDVGLTSFATLSNGDKVDNSRFFRQDEKALAKSQRRFSKSEKLLKKRRRAARRVARIHERISNRRKNFTHQLSRKLVNQYGLICVEDLEVNRMVHNRCLSKSISDAAWSQFFGYLQYKAEEAGRKLIKVNPAYTSQTCSSCGHRQKMQLSERTYSCPCCKLELDRDHNASLNILALGLQSLGTQSLIALVV